MLDLRSILLVTGALLATLGAVMMVPAMVDLAAANEDWQVFTASALLTMMVGVALWMSARGSPGQLGLRQAFVNLSGLDRSGRLLRVAASMVGQRVHLYGCLLRGYVGPHHHGRDRGRRARHRAAGRRVLARDPAMAGGAGSASSSWRSRCCRCSRSAACSSLRPKLLMRRKRSCRARPRSPAS